MALKPLLPCADTVVVAGSRERARMMVGSSFMVACFDYRWLRIVSGLLVARYGCFTSGGQQGTLRRVVEPLLSTSSFLSLYLEAVYSCMRLKGHKLLYNAPNIEIFTSLL